MKKLILSGIVIFFCLQGGLVQAQYNTKYGDNAGKNNKGSRNSFFGMDAGEHNTDGSYNTFIGQQSSELNTTGSFNVALGRNAGYNNLTGSKNTFIGTYAGDNLTSGDGNVFLGYGTGPSGSYSQRLYIGYGSTPLIYGEFNNDKVGINNSSPSYTLDVGGTIYASSDVYGSRFYDRNSTGYYVDPASTSVLNAVRATAFYDRNDTGYYVDPASTSVLNAVRATAFYDRNDTGYYVDPASTSVLNAVRATAFYDRNNTSYYVDPASSSIMNTLIADKVTLNVGSFPDYVFADEYELMPLNEVKTFIQANKHLPNMPSEQEVVENGMDVTQINTILVEKVEELTLHTISQEEEIERLNKKLEELSSKLDQVLNK